LAVAATEYFLRLIVDGKRMGDMIERMEVTEKNTMEETGKVEARGLNKIDVMVVVKIQRMRAKQEMPGNVSASG
jgi:hypothetical protein